MHEITVFISSLPQRCWWGLVLATTCPIQWMTLHYIKAYYISERLIVLIYMCEECLYRRWALSPTTHRVNVFVVACVVVFSQWFWTSKGKVLCTRFTWVEWLILQCHGEFGKHYKYVGILKSFFSHTVQHFRGVWPSHWIMGCIQVQSWVNKYNVPGSVCSLRKKP